MDSVLQNFHRCAQTLAGLMLAALAGCATVASQSAPASNAALKQEVIDTERAFARTMAMRDYTAFTGFLAEETVFFTGRVLRGKQAVAEAWKKFYEAPAAPFSWEPNEADVQVLDSGTLALSSGPVRNARGEVADVERQVVRAGFLAAFDQHDAARVVHAAIVQRHDRGELPDLL